MLRNPRVWLYASGGWLIFAGIGHLGYHFWWVMLEHGMVGQREFAMNAMKQTFSLEPLEPSMWRVFRMLSANFGLMLIFAGAIDVILAWTNAAARTMRSIALFGTAFWTVAFIAVAFVDPVTEPLLVSIVAVPMHGIAYLLANESAEGSA